MPAPVVEPRPFWSRESRFGAPDDAQDASYLAASARISSLDWMVEDMPPPLLGFLFCSYLAGLSTHGFVRPFQGLRSSR